MDELPIGRRVAYWRARRRMSQQVFADRLGKSKSWVDKVERGVRRLDKFSLINDIADVLQVDPQVLLGRECERRSGGFGVSNDEISEIRAALERYDQVNTFFEPPPSPPDLAELSKAVQHAWSTYQHAKGGALARLLPNLLRQAQAADVAYRNTRDAAYGAHLLGQTYQITSSALRNLGKYELAWLAADRAVAVSQRSGDELLSGMATFRVGLALLAMGRPRSALEISVSVASRLAPPEGHSSDRPRLSVFGMLLLLGAMAAAKLADPATTEDLLRGAQAAADALGADENHYWTCFGPTNVQLHRVAAAVELGDAGSAVNQYRVRPEEVAALVPERRIHYLLDLARGWAQIGDVARAAEMLVEGDRLAPTELRSRPVAREILGDVLRRSHGDPPPAVCELAAQVGVSA